MIRAISDSDISNMEEVKNFKLMTENKPTAFNLKWSIENFLKIPGEILSEPFALVEGQSQNWTAKVELNSDRNIFKFSLMCSNQLHSAWITHEAKALNDDQIVLKSSTTDHVYESNDEFPMLESSVSEDQLTENLSLTFEASMTVYGLALITKSFWSLETALKTRGIVPQSSIALEYESESVGEEEYAIEVKRKKFHVHRVMLKYRATNFYNQFKEISQNETLRLDDIDPKPFKAFLNYIYSSTLPKDDTLDDRQIRELYIYGSEYKMQILQDHCSKLLASKICEYNAVFILIAARNANDEILENCAKRYIVNNMDTMKYRDEWQKFKIYNPKVVEEMGF